MEEKFTTFIGNEDHIAKEIEDRMDLISSGELSCQTAIKVINEIKNLISYLRSGSRESYMTYVNILEERVLNFYARNEDGKNL